MTRAQPRPPGLRGEVFLAAEAVSAGLSPAALRSPRWRRVMHGVYADPALPADHRALCLATSLVAGPDAAIAGWSAAWLRGARSARRSSDPVHVIVPPGSTAMHRQGVVVHRAKLAEEDITELGGMRLNDTATNRMGPRHQHPGARRSGGAGRADPAAPR